MLERRNEDKKEVDVLVELDYMKLIIGMNAYGFYSGPKSNLCK